MTDLLNIYNRVVEALERLGGFYNKSTMDGKLNQKSDTGHTHSYDSITGKPSTFNPSSHAHGAIQNNGTIDSNTQAVNKVVVTDGSNNIKTIQKLPAANVTHQDISGKAPNDHSSTNTTYGVATNLKYGHVKVDDELKANSTNPVQNKVICEEFYTKDDIIELINSIETVHGKLLNIYIDEDTGDLVVNEDGFQYYTSDECDAKYPISITKQVNPSSGILARYTFTQNGSALATTIDIPKDFLLRQASLETVGATPSTLETQNNLTTGDKYIKLVVNTSDNSGATNLVIPVNDLIDSYTADETTLHLDSNNQFSIKSVPVAKISGVLPANQVTHQDISGKVNIADIVDNLNSTATNKPLSANQGNAIKLSLEGKASSSHSHGNIDSNGILKISGTAQATKNVVTDSNGKITTENKPTIPSASSSTPLIDVTGGAVGNSSNYAKADHQHPLCSDYAAAGHTHNNYLTSSDISGMMNSNDYSTVTLSVIFTDNTTGTYDLLYRSSGN